MKTNLTLDPLQSQNRMKIISFYTKTINSVLQIPFIIFDINRVLSVELEKRSSFPKKKKNMIQSSFLQHYYIFLQAV